MNEVRDICDRMLDEPAPPLRGAGEVLAIAPRANRRRQWLAAAGAGGAALSLVLGVAAGLDHDLLGRDRGANVVGAEPVPVARAAPSHGDTMTRILLDAVSGEYTTGSTETFSDSPRVRPTGPGGGRIQILAAAVIQVFGGAGRGQVFAYLVHDGQSVPDGDLCAAEPVGAASTMATCAVVWIGDVPIRLVATRDDRRGQVYQATRFVAGGRLTVAAWQGVPLDATEHSPGSRKALDPPRAAIVDRPPLDAPLLDEATVASLAADPAMIP